LRDVRRSSWKKHHKLHRQQKSLPKSIKEKEPFNTRYRDTPPPKGKKEVNHGDQEGCRLDMAVKVYKERPSVKVCDC